MNEYVLISQGVTVYLSAEQASKVGQSLKDGSDYIELEDKLIRVNSIFGIVPAEEYITSRKANRQNYLCHHGNVHTPDSWCTCGSIPVARKEYKVLQ